MHTEDFRISGEFLGIVVTNSMTTIIDIFRFRLGFISRLLD